MPRTKPSAKASSKDTEQSEATPATTLNVKPLAEEKENGSNYSPTGTEGKVHKQYLRRKQEILQSRTNVSGINIDQKMREWDKNYFNRDADIPPAEVDVDQRPIAINRAYGKVQTALGILVDRNPTYVLNENIAKFRGNREIIRALANASWKNSNSLGQFKLSVFNCAKRGFFVGRTYNRIIANMGRFPKTMESNGRIRYESRLVTHMDDIGYVNLDNRNVWIDEAARPEDMYSIRDWAWREVWHIDDIKATFPLAEFPNMRYVHSGGNTQETIYGSSQSEGNMSVTQAREHKKGMTEIFFYENYKTDWFIIEINGVMVVWEPLPQYHKRISLVTGLWSLRSAEDIYGIGVIEAMERSESLIDRINNMDLRQLLLSINPPGFYSGTEDFENEEIRLKAGVLRRTLNPKDITWLQIPKPDDGAPKRIAQIQQDEDRDTGITRAVEGDPSAQNSNDTAFELGLDKEAALKRLRIPLKSFQSALEWEAKNRIALIQQTYSDFQVEHIADQDDIFDYLDEVKKDPAYYYIENEGKSGEEKFFKKQYREVSLAVEQDEKGNFIETDHEAFFKVKPEWLAWSGSVSVDMDSLLVQSDQVEQAQTIKLTNLLMPIFQLGPEIGKKPAEQLLQAHNKDPKKWLPDAWLNPPQKEVKPNLPPALAALADRNKAAPGGAPTADPAAPSSSAPQSQTLVPPGAVDTGTPRGMPNAAVA